MKQPKAIGLPTLAPVITVSKLERKQKHCIIGGSGSSHKPDVCTSPWWWMNGMGYTLGNAWAMRSVIHISFDAESACNHSSVFLGNKTPANAACFQVFDE